MKYWIILSLLLLSVDSFATKVCHTPPCYTDATAQNFDIEKCTNAANWIATGKISIKSHDLIGMPLNKDFVSFDFLVKVWEKSDNLKMKEMKKIPFKVGWCINQIFPYESTTGLFRFYGTLTETKEDEKEYRYLYIEKL